METIPVVSNSAILRKSAITASLGLVCLFYLWTASSSDSPFTFSARPQTYYRDFYSIVHYNDYYKMQTDSFLDGRLSLIVEPKRELLELADPYDPVLNARLRLHDVSLYKGKYYLYFGAAPTVAVFMPFRLIFRKDLPENLAVAVFGFGGLVWCLLLVRLLTKRYLPATPFWIQFVAVICLSLSNVVPFILRVRGTVYAIAISSGYCFLFGGLYWLASGAQKERGSGRVWRWLLGSLFLGLAVGSRPHLVLAGITLLLLGLTCLKAEHHYSMRNAFAELLCLAVPFAVCLGLVGVYNYARFDSWTEFGTRYILQGGYNMQKWTMLDPHRILPDLFFYFLAPPRITWEFPFFHLAPSYPGALPRDYYGPEPVAGILTTIPFINILFLFPLYLWRSHPLNSSLKWAIGGFIALGLTLAVFISQVIATMRYLVDFTSLLLVAAILLWFSLDEYLKADGVKQWWLRVFSIAGIVYGCLFNVAVSLTGYGDYDALKARNPEIYHRLERVFSPGRWWVSSSSQASYSRPAESTESLLALAVQTHNAGSLEAAMDLYREVIQREPRQSQAHYNMGQIFNGWGRYANAQREYEAALEADPRFLDARLSLGVVLYAQHKLREAAEAFRNVVEASPRNSMALFDLGLSLFELGDMDGAIRSLTGAVLVDPMRTDAHYYLGLALERQKRFPEARAALQNVIGLAPRYADAYVALARVYSAQGDQRLAQEARAKAAELRRPAKQ